MWPRGRPSGARRRSRVPSRRCRPPRPGHRRPRARGRSRGRSRRGRSRWRSCRRARRTSARRVDGLGQGLQDGGGMRREELHDGQVQPLGPERLGRLDGRPRIPPSPRRTWLDSMISAGSRPTSAQWRCRTSRLWAKSATVPPTKFQCCAYWPWSEASVAPRCRRCRSAGAAAGRPWARSARRVSVVVPAAKVVVSCESSPTSTWQASSKRSLRSRRRPELDPVGARLLLVPAGADRRARGGRPRRCRGWRPCWPGSPGAGSGCRSPARPAAGAWWPGPAPSASPSPRGTGRSCRPRRSGRSGRRSSPTRRPSISSAAPEDGQHVGPGRVLRGGLDGEAHARTIWPRRGSGGRPDALSGRGRRPSRAAPGGTTGPPVRRGRGPVPRP